MPNIKGVILAGGQSSRMGQDKANLNRDHRDMFRYTLDQLENMKLNGIVVSRNDTQVLPLNSLPLITDLYPQAGPLGGIHAISQKVNADGVLIVPIDMPMLVTEDLQRLVNVGSQLNKPAYFKDTFLPLYLPLNPCVRDYLEKVVLGKINNRSVRALCDYFGGIPLQAQSTERLLNTNTPQQWQEAKDRLAESPC